MKYKKVSLNDSYPPSIGYELSHFMQFLKNIEWGKKGSYLIKGYPNVAVTFASVQGRLVRSLNSETAPKPPYFLKNLIHDAQYKCIRRGFISTCWKGPRIDLFKRLKFPQGLYSFNKFTFSHCVKQEQLTSNINGKYMSVYALLEKTGRVIKLHLDTTNGETQNV